MYNYHVTVTQLKENPNYDPEKVAKTLNQAYHHEYADNSDQKYLRERVLEIELDQQEFQELKKAVLSVM